MPQIVPIVEGDGEEEAAPMLLRRLLWEDFARFDIQVGAPKVAHGRANLLKTRGIERFVSYALMEREVAAVLLLLDAEQDVPCEVACRLRERITILNPSVPVAVVCAECQYESWFVDSIEALCGSCDIDPRATWPEVPPPNPKRWLRNLMPRGRTYKETNDQAPLTAPLDFARLRQRSRSFRRLRHAVEELLGAHDAGEAIVTPVRCDPEKA